MSPKVRLEYTLPEERSDYTLALKAGEMYYMLSEISNKLRTYRKYADFSDKGMTGRKRKSKVATAAVSFFFDKLDNELLDILKDMPEVE